MLIADNGNDFKITQRPCSYKCCCFQLYSSITRLIHTRFQVTNLSISTYNHCNKPSLQQNKLYKSAILFCFTNDSFILIRREFD